MWLPSLQTLFAGNTDDHFMLGIKLTRGSVVLTTDFLQADIIAASPLGVVTRLEEDAKAREDGRPQAKDFLSSVEILVLERADTMLMQVRRRLGRPRHPPPTTRKSAVRIQTLCPKPTHAIDVFLHYSKNIN